MATKVINIELMPWFSVATPHEDIRKGRLDEAVFAANLWAVVQGAGPNVYLDPEEFFEKTCITSGIGTLLTRVAAALRGDGDSGDRIVSLQTSFGGGKTHSLIALWHLAKHGAKLKKCAAGGDLRKVLGDRLPDKPCNVAVFTNASCDATQGRKTPDGIHTHTLWGELAAQLGGKSLYQKIRANDESRRVPQGLFADVLRAAAPCLILLDELADYCVGAAAVPVEGTSLADQTISFIQQLTDAVQQVPGTVVIATLPASKMEVANSEKGQEAFVTLERRFQRLGADVKPVADEEIYSVVRTRLFESIAPKDYPTKIAKAYHILYNSHSSEVPSETTKASYQELIERAYPFHPSVIDTLYTRWGSHPDFQRTRGVLRLLASVVGDLWQRRNTNTQSQWLIQPCHLRWSIDALQASLTRLWGLPYQSICAADVCGQKSNPAVLDETRGDDYAREQIGQGLAAAILLGSFGGQAGRSGFSGKDLKVACSRPTLNWNYIDGALTELEDRCFYLYSGSAGSLGRRYWFGTKPGLNKLVVQYRQGVARKDFDEEIIEALSEQAGGASLGGATWKVLVRPKAELPEQKALTLLVLPPTLPWGEDDGDAGDVKRSVLDLSTRCGNKERTYRNTLVFLAGSAKGIARLRQAYREVAALEDVDREYGTQLDQEQREELKAKIGKAREVVHQTLCAAYTVALRVVGQEVQQVSLEDAGKTLADHLACVWKALVEDEEWILRKVGSVTLRDAGLVPEKGGLRLKDAIDAFLRFTDKPMLASKDAVTSGLTQACRDGSIGLARGHALTKLDARYCGKDAVSALGLLDPAEEGVWIIPPFEAAPSEEPEKEGEEGGDAGAGEGGEGGGRATTTGEHGDEGKLTRKRIRRITVTGSVPVEHWADIFRSFINPAVRAQLQKTKLGINFEFDGGADSPLHEDDPLLLKMKESAQQLGLQIEME